jgi:hypothetical protein
MEDGGGEAALLGVLAHRVTNEKTRWAAAERVSGAPPGTEGGGEPRFSGICHAPAS